VDFQDVSYLRSFVDAGLQRQRRLQLLLKLDALSEQTDLLVDQKGESVRILRLAVPLQCLLLDIAFVGEVCVLDTSVVSEN